MNSRKFHEIWIEQCDAAHDIKRRYGVQAAFDYLVGEKLFNFVDAAATRPEFANELPRFIAYIPKLFSRRDILTHLARLERERIEYAADNDNNEFDEFDGDDELIRESPEAVAQHRRQFTEIKELLTAAVTL